MHDGAIVGCSWTRGRWPQKGALEFKRPSDRVRVNVPGEFQSLTLFAWVRLDSIDHEFNSLLLTDGYDERDLHWQIRRGGRIEVAIKGLGNFVTPRILGPEDIGRWVQLALTVDGERRRISQYVDGESVFQARIEAPARVRIGDAEIGNWGVAASGDTQPVRALNGRVDEFAVFGEALGSDELREIYESGRPR